MRSFEDFYNQRVVNESIMDFFKDPKKAVAAALILGIINTQYTVPKLNQIITNVYNSISDKTVEEIQALQNKVKQVEATPHVDRIIKQASSNLNYSNPQKSLELHKRAVETSDDSDVFSLVRNVLRDIGAYNEKAYINVLANIRAECGPAMKPIAENMEYSAKRLRDVFSKYFTPVTAKKYEYNETAIGDRVYGNRLGNGPNEGHKYRGRGYFQITGKYNYKKYSKLLGIDLVNNPDLALEPKVAAQILKAQLQEYIKRGVDLSNMSQLVRVIGPANLSTRIKERNKFAAQILHKLATDSSSNTTAGNK